MGQVLPFLETLPSSSSPRPVRRLQPKVLIVENDPELQNYFKTRLRKGEYTVQIAATGQEALQRFQDSGPFDVVVIDYSIPQTQHHEIDHLAACQTHSVELALAIRNERPTQEIVIMARDYCNAAEVPLPTELHVRVLAGSDQLFPLLERIEVERAINALTDADRIRLKDFANYKIRGLGPMATDRDWQDLLNESACRTLLGTRHWKANVDFVYHLRETMRSVADQWKRRLRAPSFADNAATDSEGEEYSLLDRVVSMQVSVESWLIEVSELTRVLDLFKDDPDADCILRSVAAGLKKGDIMSKYGFQEKRYKAALRRIRQMFRPHSKGDN